MPAHSSIQATALIVPNAAQCDFLSAPCPGTVSSRLEIMTERLHRIPGVESVHTSPPGDPGDRDHADHWTKALATAGDTGSDILIICDGLDYFFHEQSLERALAMLQHTGAAFVRARDATRGTVPAVLSRRALEWALEQNRHRAIPLPPLQLLEMEAPDDLPGVLLPVPGFLRQSGRATGEHILSLWAKRDSTNDNSPEITRNYVTLLEQERRARVLEHCDAIRRATIPGGHRPNANKPHRIMLISNVSKIGGAENSLMCMVRNADPGKVKYFLVCPGEGNLSECAAEAGATVFHVPLNSLGQGFAALLDTVGNIAQIIRSRDIQLVHINSVYACQMGAAAACAAGVPAVCHIQDIHVEPHIIHNALLPVCNNVIAASQAVSRAALDWGLAGKRIRVLYYGVETSLFRPDRNTQNVVRELNLQNRPVVILVGHLVPWKGHRIFIEAANQIRKRHPDAKFLIAGGELFPGRVGGYAHELKALICELELEGNMSLLGNRSDIPDLLSASSVAVHTSLLPDPFPWSVLEAMSAGLPVVGADAGGVPEALDHGNAGVTVPPGDAQALAQAVCRLLDDPDAAAELGRRARERVLKHYRIEDHVAAMQGLFSDIIEGMK